MKKTHLTLAIIIILLLPFAVYAYICCPEPFDSDNEVEPIIGRGMFLYLKNPLTSPITESETHDLINFYYSLGQNCNSLGSRSGYRYIDIANKIENVGYAECLPAGILSPPFFLIKNNAGENIAVFDNIGNLGLKGNCTALPSCAFSGDDSFIIQNPLSQTVAYIDSSGNLCIQDSDCSDLDASCSNPGDGSFIVQHTSGQIVSYINSTGALCLIGELLENTVP